MTPKVTLENTAGKAYDVFVNGKPTSLVVEYDDMDREWDLWTRGYETHICSSKVRSRIIERIAAFIEAF